MKAIEYIRHTFFIVTEGTAETKPYSDICYNRKLLTDFKDSMEVGGGSQNWEPVQNCKNQCLGLDLITWQNANVHRLNSFLERGISYHQRCAYKSSLFDTTAFVMCC